MKKLMLMFLIVGCNFSLASTDSTALKKQDVLSWPRAEAGLLSLVS